MHTDFFLRGRWCCIKYKSRYGTHWLGLDVQFGILFLQFTHWYQTLPWINSYAEHITGIADDLVKLKEAHSDKLLNYC